MGHTFPVHRINTELNARVSEKNEELLWPPANVHRPTSIDTTRHDRVLSLAHTSKKKEREGDRERRARTKVHQVAQYSRSESVALLKWNEDASERRGFYHSCKLRAEKSKVSRNTLAAGYEMT